MKENQLKQELADNMAACESREQNVILYNNASEH